VVRVRERTIPTEPPPLVDDVSANLRIGWLTRRIPYGHILEFSRPEPLSCLATSSSVVPRRLSGPRYSSGNLVAPGIASSPSESRHGVVFENSDLHKAFSRRSQADTATGLKPFLLLIARSFRTCTGNKQRNKNAN
jgi:hypothetical protein